MRKNEKIKLIVIIVGIVVAVCLLLGFSYRIQSRNQPEIGSVGDDIRLIGGQLESALGDMGDARDGIAESIDRTDDYIGDLGGTKDEYIESSREIDNRFNQHEADTAEIIGAIDEVREYGESDSELITRGREEIGLIREGLQEIIDMGQD